MFFPLLVHVQRMDEKRLPKKIMKLQPKGKEKRDRLKKTWLYGIPEDIKESREPVGRIEWSADREYMED